MAEIGLKDYLRLLDGLLKLQDQRGFPAQLETGDVKPVFDIAQFLPLFNTTTKSFSLNSPLDAIVGPHNAPILSTGEDGSYDFTGKNIRIFGIGCTVSFSVAGAIAAAGQRISNGYQILDRVSGLNIPFNFNQIENGKLVVAAIQDYRFYLGASSNTSIYNALLNNLLIGSNLRVPTTDSVGFSLINTILLTTGAGVPVAFPAVTSITHYAVFYETLKPLIPPM